MQHVSAIPLFPEVEQKMARRALAMQNAPTMEGLYRKYRQSIYRVAWDINRGGEGHRLSVKLDCEKFLQKFFQKAVRRQQQVLTLRFLGQLSQFEVAKIMGVHTRTVRTIEKKIRDGFNREFGNYFDR